MNNKQAVFVEHILSRKVDTVSRCAMKNHQVCYFMPAWLRDGAPNEAQYFRVMQPDVYEYALIHSDHPKHLLALKAKAELDVAIAAGLPKQVGSL